MKREYAPQHRRWYTDQPGDVFTKMVTTPPSPAVFAELQFMTEGGYGSCELERHHNSGLHIPSRVLFGELPANVFMEKIHRHSTILRSSEEYQEFTNRTLPLLIAAGYTPRIGMLAFRVRKEHAEESLHFIQQGGIGRISYFEKNRPDIDATVLRYMNELSRGGQIVGDTYDTL